MRLSKALKPGLAASVLALAMLGACETRPDAAGTASPSPAEATEWPYADVTVDPASWPKLTPPPLDPAIEAQIDAILPRLTLEQKVGQIIQADSSSVTPEQVKKYRLGSVLSGGNSAPGEEPYADAATWLAAADAYFLASLDPEGVEIPVPVIWGIDAVHGHTNLLGGTVFPHNIGLGAANDPGLIREIAEATARELIVSGHDWTFAPTLAVPRDDRWGRSYEGFSEGPDIVASYAAGIVEGLQGRRGEAGWMGEGRVISSAKHFVADGGTLNGRDQGDAVISEAELRDIHAAGYFPAISADVQTIMASFSSWNGIKIHGSRALLNDIMKERLGFQGFIIGDWNAHGQIPGCTNTDCPQSLLAGLDMYMAPDSWQGLYYSTLGHVKSGAIPMERLDDAVRRILRVKIAYGLFDRPVPSARPGAGDVSILSSEAHKGLARRAVRQSLVLLKNDGGVLPLSAGQTVLVIGDGADSITKAAGGWTLSWQGGGYDNSYFPNGQSILSGIRDVVEAAGGTVIHDPEGMTDVHADVVIAVYGEDPYAEFQGDVDHLAFTTDKFDTSVLAARRAGGAKVVSVFLSGRPMWVNRELNASDAFVAAWLPGSEGGGVADVLFRTDPAYDFTGRLSFSWPATAIQSPLNKGDPDYAPLFPYGYGLSYASPAEALGAVPEVSGLAEEAGGGRGTVFVRGQASVPWSLRHTGMAAGPARTDHRAQEDALILSAPEGAASLAFFAGGDGVDWSRESNGALELSFFARSVGGANVASEVAMGCAADGACARWIGFEAGPDWTEHRVSLSCFADAGVDMRVLRNAASFRIAEGAVALAAIQLAEDKDGRPDCGS
ncbi:glycoside hydrolase family 3 N-terminal domain-containing protein [Hyphomonas sp.]|uniref:glycoside hydrolase family 3 protein n=1 Tax=Hyphomonas sp. TaxID=87 RepID=UPI00391A38E1